MSPCRQVGIYLNRRHAPRRAHHFAQDRGVVAQACTDMKDVLTLCNL